MRKFSRALIIVFFLSIGTCMDSSAEIQPGEITTNLTADLDGDGKLEVIAIRQCTPPIGFERVEIFEDKETNQPAFASEWKELEEGLLLSSEGHLKLEKIGSRVLAKYIWMRRGMGTGGGHELEHITYYGYVNGKFGPVFEYTARKLNWYKSRFGQTGYSDEAVGTVSFKDIDGDGSGDLLMCKREEDKRPGKG